MVSARFEMTMRALQVLAGAIALSASGVNFPVGTYIYTGSVLDYRHEVMTADAGLTIQAVSTNGTVLASSRVTDPVVSSGVNFVLEVPADDCRVIAVHEVVDRPFVLSTSRHVASPLIDVAEEHWDAETKTLSGVSRVVPGEEYELRIFVDGRIVRRSFRPSDSTLTWQIKF